jgi:DNA mismatch repair ATPase MutS
MGGLHLALQLLTGFKGKSLLSFLDHTKTPLGRLELKDRLQHPLREEAAIRRRLDEIQALLADTSLGAVLGLILARGGGGG